jgi:hypothetical protein
MRRLLTWRLCGCCVGGLRCRHRRRGTCWCDLMSCQCHRNWRIHAVGTPRPETVSAASTPPARLRIVLPLPRLLLRGVVAGGVVRLDAGDEADVVGAPGLIDQSARGSLSTAPSRHPGGLLCRLGEPRHARGARHQSGNQAMQPSLLLASGQWMGSLVVQLRFRLG